MERKFEISDALLSLRPNAAWSISGLTYADLNWLDQTQTPPTEEECLIEVARLQQEYDNLKYQRDRQKEYPSFADQFDILYHQGYDGWKSVIETIKSKYPKPEGL